jgi:hypothetical protein
MPIKRKLYKGLTDYRVEYDKQKREHPSLPTWALRVIVKDHLRKGKKNYG